MEELLSLKESIVTYLDRSGGLRKLVETCQTLKGRFGTGEYLISKSLQLACYSNVKSSSTNTSSFEDKS